ncbi:MAG: phosphoenolpyruvate carboxykinase (GTP) [Acholeplasmataceae bacterium]|jgi:phosphoenolpyruvate carboxykinase (GTP)|nr:phosphoenolpyruvate carboxykinase (GTP) [Acholeplasmataceae bacterium]
MISYQDLHAWVDQMAKMCQPRRIYWCDGSKEENDRFMKELVDSKKAIKLNPLKKENSYAFFSDPSDVARVENRTFIASIHESDAGPTNQWRDPKELKETMTFLFNGSMKGRTMYVIPFMMGPFGSPLSKIGIQLTDSLYVVTNMRIMTRMGTKVLDELSKLGSFIPCLHSVGYPLEDGQEDVSWPSAPIDQKYISHFPEERLIWSYGSGYGGNALLGKKCLALRIATVIAREENWMAEHMLILKLTNPTGKVKYILGAFPSACGKTNLSMLVPTIPGWKVETIGDDIAWIWMKEDGRLYAINPESGFFGVAKGTSYQSNPNAMKAIQKNTIFTNVAITDDHDVWWEGIDGDVPDHLMDWRKKDWFKGDLTPAAHPNSRFTVSTSQCPVISSEWESPEGVLISAILVGGRRPNTIPLVHEATSWNHGVFMGSMMGSEITAAAISDMIGQVRRDPFAMLPFIGYHVGDYLKHWIDMKNLTTEDKLPKIFYVNWFRKDADNHFAWPGFGENSRVLKWIFERCDGTGKAKITPIGYMPTHDAIDTTHLNITREAIDQLTHIDITEWLDEVKSIRTYYKTIGDKLPKELIDELDQLELRLNHALNQDQVLVKQKMH